MKKYLSFLFPILLLLSGCQSGLPEVEAPTVTSQATYTAVPTQTEPPAYTALPTYTLQPTFTASPLPSKTVSPTIAPTLTEVPSYTPLPTLTLLPTNEPIGPKMWVTITPYPVITLQAPSQLKEVFSCEDISISVVYSNPELVKVISGRFPVGSFLMMRVSISSTSGKTYEPLTNESFRILGSLYGRDVVYYLERTMSDYANSRWETANLNTKVSGSPFETYLVFDVNEFTTNYSLEFCPTPTGELYPIGCVTFPLPTIKK